MQETALRKSLLWLWAITKNGGSLWDFPNWATWQQENATVLRPSKADVKDLNLKKKVWVQLYESYILYIFRISKVSAGEWDGIHFVLQHNALTAEMG